METKEIWEEEFLLHATTSTINHLPETTMSSNIRIEKTCQLCGKLFIAKTTVTKFCGHDCSRKAYKKTKRTEKIELAIEKEIKTKVFNPMISSKEYLSIAETCQLLGTSRWTIYRMLQNGKLQHTKIGTRTIIARKEIDKLFNYES